MQERFPLHGLMRVIIGAILVVIALVMVWASDDLGWGIAATTIVPAIFIAIPGLSLLKRKVLILREQGVELEVGWLWRRCQYVSLEGAQLELVPMTGLWAVAVHKEQGRPYPLALWVKRSKAEAVLAFLDQIAPQGEWPRKQHEAAEWDR